MFHHYQSLLYLQCLSEKKSVQTFIKEKNYGIARKFFFFSKNSQYATIIFCKLLHYTVIYLYCYY